MGNPADTPIARILLHYYPDWEVPDDSRDWNECLCPDHPEDNPSCAVNFEAGAVKCLACGFQGDVTSIVRRKEGVRYAEALRQAQAILGERYDEVQKQSPKKHSRRVFGGSGSQPRRPASQPVSTRVRGRPAPWT